MDLAVDGTKLLGEQFLGLVNETLEAILDGGSDLVAAICNDVGVVGRPTAVPGKELEAVSSFFSHK
jgi:hypothetical protein